MPKDANLGRDAPDHAQGIVKFYNGEEDRVICVVTIYPGRSDTYLNDIEPENTLQEALPSFPRPKAAGQQVDSVDGPHDCDNGQGR